MSLIFKFFLEWCSWLHAADLDVSMAVADRAHRLIVCLSKLIGYDIVRKTEFQWELPVQFTDVHKEFEKPCNRVEMPFKFLKGGSFNCVTVGCVTQRHHFCLVVSLLKRPKQLRLSPLQKICITAASIYAYLQSECIIWGQKDLQKKCLSSVSFFP